MKILSWKWFKKENKMKWNFVAGKIIKWNSTKKPYDSRCCQLAGRQLKIINNIIFKFTMEKGTSSEAY